MSRIWRYVGDGLSGAQAWRWVPGAQSGGVARSAGAGEAGDTQAVQACDIRDGEVDPQFRISVPGAVFTVPVAGGLLPVPVALPWCGVRFPVPVPGPTAPGGAAPPRRT